MKAGRKNGQRTSCRQETSPDLPSMVKVHFPAHPLIQDRADPIELFDFQRKSRARTSPAQQLMLAVVQNAAEQYLYRWRFPGSSPKALHEEADWWFKDTRYSSFIPFADICEVFRWESSSIIRRLKTEFEENGPSATDALFDPLDEYAEALTPTDVDQVVSQLFRIPHIGECSRRLWQPKYMYFRTLALTFHAGCEEVKDICRHFGWTFDRYFFERVTLFPLPHSMCRTAVSALQHLAMMRMGFDA